MPYEQLCKVTGFKVHTMTNVVSQLNLHVMDFNSVPDHSLLECKISHNAIDDEHVLLCESNVELLPKAPRRFKMNVHNNLFLSDDIQTRVVETIERIQTIIDNRESVDVTL